MSPASKCAVLLAAALVGIIVVHQIMIMSALAEREELLRLLREARQETASCPIEKPREPRSRVDREQSCSAREEPCPPCDNVPVCATDLATDDVLKLESHEQWCERHIGVGKLSFHRSNIRRTCTGKDQWIECSRDGNDLLCRCELALSAGMRIAKKRPVRKE